MSERAPNTVVRIEPSFHGDYLVGERSAIESHPKCPAGMFDGEGSSWKVQRTLTIPDGRRFEIRRMGRRYRLYVPFTNIEAAQRREQTDRDRGAQQALAKAKKELASMPATSEAYRADTLEICERFAFRLLPELAGGTFPTIRGGYMLNEEQRTLVGIHVQALRQIFESGMIVLDQGARQQAVDEIMAPVRQADPGFKAFLGQFTSTQG